MRVNENQKKSSPNISQSYIYSFLKKNNKGNKKGMDFSFRVNRLILSGWLPMVVFFRPLGEYGARSDWANMHDRAPSTNYERVSYALLCLRQTVLVRKWQSDWVALQTGLSWHLTLSIQISSLSKASGSNFGLANSYMCLLSLSNPSWYQE